MKTFPELVTKNDSSFYTIELPQYFRAPQAWEDIWDADWLINGAHPRVYNVPQLADAVFSRDGRLIVIWNGTATWSNEDNARARTLFERPGGWKISSQWLEIYATNGVLVGAYALPEPAPHVIWASEMGLLFLLGADGAVSVVADPTTSGPCRALRRTIDIPYVDSPYQEPLVSAAFLN